VDSSRLFDGEEQSGDPGGAPVLTRSLQLKQVETSPRVGSNREFKKSKKQAEQGVFCLIAVVIAIALVCTRGVYLQRQDGTQRPDILEVFGGHSKVNMQASKRGRPAMQLYDIASDDPRDPEQVQAFKDAL
jgi:hypothetical protein